MIGHAVRELLLNFLENNNNKHDDGVPSP